MHFTFSSCLVWSSIVLGCAYAETPNSPSDDVSILINEVAKANNQSLLWGPYKPNLYFGVKPRIPKSLTAGLIWGNVDAYETAQSNFRHTCEQNEGMKGYGWDEYDVRKGGRQTIHDVGNSVDLTIDFVKIPGGHHGGSWAARVKGVVMDDAPADLHTSVIFYASLEGLGNVKVDTAIENQMGLKGDVKLRGVTPELGEFSIDVTAPESNKHPEFDHPSSAEKTLRRPLVASLQTPPEHLWQVKPLLFTAMKPDVEALFEKYGTESPPPAPRVFTVPNHPGSGNMHFVQHVFEGSFEFDILFESGSAPQPVTSETLTEKIEEISASFSSRYENIFAPQAPFNKPEYSEFSKAMFSNLVGGIGYFHGSGFVDRSEAPEYDEENEGFWEEAAEARARVQPTEEDPRELFTSIPSRPFFPRGFLWDEGFHLLPVVDWDLDLTLDIVKSWFNLMDEDGWIGREQILGVEARSKVPQEFTVQYPHYANPPTLFMVLEAFVDKLKFNETVADGLGLERGDVADSLRSAHLKSKDLALSYLRSIYPLLRRQYSWFKKTQRGDVKSYDREAYSSREAYRWRGRTVRHILTSGLDDYPRPQPPHPGELHTDLISWMGLLSRSLRKIAEAIGETDDVEEFAVYEHAISRNIDDLHWDEDAQTWCDATIDEYEESVHVCHKGYISIFPFMTGMVGPDSPHLKATLDLIHNSDELWSDYGVRSLSKNDEFYGTDENYWRSPVWMNMNYMIVKNLYDIATAQGPHRKQAAEIYSQLRKNLVENVFQQWKETGFAWEQYNPETGKGQRTQHFTGWTSLVVKIMNMPDITASGKGHDEL